MLPVTKKSKMRKRTRRSHHAKRPPGIAECPQCGQARRPHRACENCGYVNSHTSIPAGTQES
ncbi:MAG: 50S ribosomal protein L32 [Phycisphaerales bacterium]|nr:50S ribosomal protein L32 [Phycisphaerales bacterium]